MPKHFEELNVISNLFEIIFCNRFFFLENKIIDENEGLVSKVFQKKERDFLS